MVNFVEIVGESVVEDIAEPVLEEVTDVAGAETEGDECSEESEEE